MLSGVTGYFLRFQSARPPASRPDPGQQGIHDYSNLALLTIATLPTNVPAPLALVPNPLTHSPGLAGAKPVVDVRGGLVGKECPGFIIIEYLSRFVVAQRLGRVGKNLVLKSVKALNLVC